MRGFNPTPDQAAAERTLPTVFVGDTLAQRTADLLDSFAEERPSEGVVYWFGLELGEQAVVTTLVVPDADTQTGAVHTTIQANVQALSTIVGTPLVLLGQTHSHPASNVRHSPIDDRDTFARFEGALSVVVPYFGRYGLDLHTSGVYRHINGRFEQILPDVMAGHLVVLPGFADLRCPSKGSLQ